MMSEDVEFNRKSASEFVWTEGAMRLPAGIMEFEHLQNKFHSKPETRMGRGGNCSVMANFDSSSRLLRRKSHEWRGVKLIYCGSILVRTVLEKEDNKIETWESEVSGIRARYLTLNLFARGSRFLSVFLQSVVIKDIFIMRTRTL